MTGSSGATPTEGNDGVIRVVGLYGTAELSALAPPHTAQQVLDALGGPPPQTASPLQAAQDGARVTELLSGDLIAQVLGTPAGATLTWGEEDEAQANASVVELPDPPGPPAPRPHPQPRPGSGRRRRKAVRSADGNGGPDSGKVASPPSSHSSDASSATSMDSGAHPTQVMPATQAQSVTAGSPGSVTPPEGATAPFTPIDTGPLVAAVLCTAGHANPPGATACQSCRAPLTGEIRKVPCPMLATLALSTGEAVAVRGDVVIGRAPQQMPGSEPGTQALVPVPSPTHLVSRSHLVVTTKGWNLLARDLGSNNGTVLVRPGNAPVLLASALPTPLLVGDFLDLGDGVTVRIEAPL